MRFCKGDVNVCGVSVRDRPPSCSAPQHGEAVACVVKHIYTDTKTFFVFSVLVGLDATAVHIFREGITHEKIGRTWKKIGRRNPREKRALILPFAAGSIPSPQAGVIYVSWRGSLLAEACCPDKRRDIISRATQEHKIKI